VITTPDPVGVAIAKFSPGGQLDRVFQLDGTYLTPEVYIAAGQAGDFYLSGNFSEQIVFGSKTFEAGEFNQDIFIAKYDAMCGLTWAKHAHSFASDQVAGMVTDQDDNLYITGHYLDSLYIDNLKLRYTLCCGSREIFIIGIDPWGEVLWGEQVTGTRANIQAISMSGQGELLLSGLFSEDITMGPLKLTNYDGFRNYITCLDTETVTFIENEIPGGELTLFPNPAKDYLRITGNPEGSPTGYIIYSIYGSLASSGNLSHGNSVYTGALCPGRYILQLTGPGTGSGFSGQFVKY
jgi:hypothetical protein